MRKFALIIAAALLFAAPSAFAEKTYVTKTVSVVDFTSVDCSLPCEIEYVSGEPSFKITATQDVLDHLVAAVSENTLKICLDKTKIFNMGNIKVWISSPKLKEITINGSIDFKALNGIVTDTFDATLNGASELNIKGLSANDAVVSANGAASMEIDSASCKHLEVSLNGAGDCDLKNVDCGTLDLTVNGAGGCDVDGHVKQANLTVNGVGGIDARKLNADAMNSAVNGIGKISRN